MADYVSPDARRRIAGGLMAAQYAENPPTAPMGYDFDAAPLSPGLMNFAAQRGQPGVIQKTLGLIPGFDQDGKRGAQSWGNALMSTAQFPIDAVAGMGQALTAPARAYRGEFDPTSEEGVGEALNVAGNAMMGGLAAPKPRNVVGKVEPPVSVTGYRGVTDPANINSPDRVTFYSDRPELADLYARDYQSYGRRWPWEDDKTMFANAARSDAAPWPSADRSVAIKGSDVGYSDGAAVARRDMTFNRPWTITGEELTGKIDAAGGFGIGDVLPDIVQQARSRGVDGIVLKDVQDIGGKQNQFISLFANGGKQGAGIGSAIGSAGGDLKGAALGAIPDTPGIRAYHGSPHDFDRFDMSKIGTGEGAQAYGHGLYFAENEGVAKSYRDGLSSQKSMPSMADAMNAAEAAAPELKNGPNSISSLIAPFANYPDPAAAMRTRAAKSQDPVIQRAYEAAASSLEGKGPGRMYEVNIKANPDDFLDWDKPISQQPKVAGLVGTDEQGRLILPNGERAPPDKLRGESFYRAFAEANGGGTQAGSDAIRQAGIPGIRYLDQGSRAGGEGSRNLVVFDDKLIEILRKYGLLGMAGGAAAAEYGFGAPQPSPASPRYRPGDA